MKKGGVFQRFLNRFLFSAVAGLFAGFLFSGIPGIGALLSHVILSEEAGILRVQNALSAGNIVITEIAAFEKDGEEWLEIYNRGESSINLEGWKFWEEGINHSLTAVKGSFELASKSFAVIAENGNAFAQKYPAIVTIFDSSWGTLKESGELIGLKDAALNMVEQFQYLPAADKSLQRKNALTDEYGPENWTESMPTPDAAWIDAGTNEPHPKPESPQTESVNVEEIPPKRQILDYAFGNVAINEVYVKPDKGEKEWAELRSFYPQNIDLKNWTLKDGSGAKTALSGTLYSWGFVVIESPNGKLNDSGDALYLYDHTGKLIDSLVYGEFDIGSPVKNINAPPSGHSLARRAGENVTFDNVKDFEITTKITPGSENVIENVIEKRGADSGGIPSLLMPAAALASPPPTLGPASSTSSSPPASPTSSTLKSTELTPEEYCKNFISARSATSTLLKNEMLKDKPPKDESLFEGGEEKNVFAGSVIAPPGIFGRRIFYLANNSGVMQIYKHDGDLPKLKFGENVIIKGETSTAYGENRLKISKKENIQRIEGDAAQNSGPKNIVISDIDGENAEFVRIKGEVVEKAGKNFYLGDETGEIFVQAAGIKTSGAEASGIKIQIKDLVEVIGVSRPSRSGVKLYPRYANDIKIKLGADEKEKIAQKNDSPSESAQKNRAGFLFGRFGNMIDFLTSIF